MAEEQQEYYGEVIFLKERYGFIKMLSESNSIYFQLKSCQNSVCVKDKVAFLLKEGKGGIEATAIRLIFSNQYGITFIPCVNKHHIHLNLVAILPHIIKDISDYTQEEIEILKNIPTLAGETICVKTSPNDKITYAIRKGKFGHSRLVHNRIPEKCSSVFCVLERTAGYYLIKTIYVGEKANKEPWDKTATTNDLMFWEDHALIYNTVEIIEGSETAFQPWMLNQPAISKIKNINKPPPTGHQPPQS
jgi:hypothetical protein